MGLPAVLKTACWGYDGKGQTGLANVGNTCYFNSLLQTYFTIPEFVEQIMIFKFNEEEAKEEEKKEISSNTKPAVPSSQETEKLPSANENNANLIHNQ